MKEEVFLIKLVLLNQFTILKKISNDNERNEYSKLIEAFENGFEDYFLDEHYHYLKEHDMDIERCAEITKLIDMYDCVLTYLEHNSNDALKAKVVFEGFDGNNELNEMYFAKYFLKTSNLFSRVKGFIDFNKNSHTLMMPTYKKRTDYYFEAASSCRGKLDKVIEDTFKIK